MADPAVPVNIDQTPATFKTTYAKYLVKKEDKAGTSYTPDDIKFHDTRHFSNYQDNVDLAFQERLAMREYNFLQFGADPTGVGFSDDAWTEAISVIDAASGRGKLVIPAGTYKFASELPIAGPLKKGYITIEGMGHGTVMKAAPGCTTLFTSLDTNPNAEETPQQTFNVTIRNLKIKGNAPGFGCLPFNLSNCVFCLVEDIYIEDMGYVLNMHGNAYRSTVRRLFAKSNANGTSIDGDVAMEVGSGAKVCTIQDSFLSQYNTNIAVNSTTDRTCYSLLIENVHVTKTDGYGFGIEAGAAGTTYDCRIINCSVYDSPGAITGAVIQSNNVQYTLIRDCSFIDVPIDVTNNSATSTIILHEHRSPFLLRDKADSDASAYVDVSYSVNGDFDNKIALRNGGNVNAPTGIDMGDLWVRHITDFTKDPYNYPISDHIILSSTWGADATIDTVEGEAGPSDLRGTIRITADGAGIGSNPTWRYNFKRLFHTSDNNAGPTIVPTVVIVARRGDFTGTPLPFEYFVDPDGYILCTLLQTPTSGQFFEFSYMVMG